MKLCLRVVLLLFFVLTVSFVSVYVAQEGATVQAAEEKVTDPACGMEIDKSSAIAVEFEGNTYYVCSEVCKAKFEKDPGIYACLCTAGAMPVCKCGHCQKTADKCDCGSESAGQKGEGQHHEGEHHH
ncbi:MAG: YHS domain-containing protein [Candidatus Brocadiales bacterium]|nr:YHS domain-containing protein [Candidatus Bathyanammoxibius amoris]